MLFLTVYLSPRNCSINLSKFILSRAASPEMIDSCSHFCKKLKVHSFNKSDIVENLIFSSFFFNQRMRNARMKTFSSIFRQRAVCVGLSLRWCSEGAL